MKSKIVAYFLWLIGVFGCLGFHRFYLGKTKTGVIWLLTGGLIGIGSLLDLFTLGEQVKQVNSLRILEKMAHGEEVTKFKRLLGEDPASRVATHGYCPYCMGILGRQRKRKIKCPFCQKEIYLRPDPLIFDHSLLTAEEAVVVDHLPKFNKLGITVGDFQQKRLEMQEKFGTEVTAVDVIWSLFQQTIQNTKDLVILKEIYHQLALFLKNLKWDYYYILQRAIKMQLLEYQRDGFTKRVKITTSGSGSCPACGQLEGRIYTIDDALKLMPLPCKECSHKLTKHFSGFCQCSFQAVQ
jgi:TM2 domain